MTARAPATFLLLVLAGCAATPQAPPPSPQIVGWKRTDGATAPAGEAEQARLICQNYAQSQANEAPSVLMQLMTLDSALKGCMAQRGFIPVYDR